MSLSAHAKAQALRFARLFIIAFVGSGVLVAGSWDSHALLAAIVGAVEVAYRQLSQVVPAPAPAPASEPPATPAA